MNKKLCHIDYFQRSCSVLENLLNKPSAIPAGHKPHLKRIIGCQEYIEKSWQPVFQDIFYNRLIFPLISKIIKAFYVISFFAILRDIQTCLFRTTFS